VESGAIRDAGVGAGAWADLWALDAGWAAAARPMAASKKAFWAAARAASAPAADGVVGWTGKALGRIGVTGRRLDYG